MKVQIFTLCDGAYNYNGKLTIVGTIDNIKVPKVPSIASVGLAVKLLFPQEERGDKRITVRFKDASSNLIIPEISINSRDEGKKGEEEKIVIAGILNGLDIKDYGDYVVELDVNGKVTPLLFKVVR